MSNFLQRTLTTIIGGALMVVLILLGREFLLGVLLFASVVGYYELSGAFGVRGQEQKINAMTCVGYISVFAWYALLEIRSLGFINSETFSLIEVCGIILMLMAHMSVYVFKYPEYDATRTISSFFSVIYCPVMLSFVYMIRSLDKGVLLVWMVFICSWICDISAYLVGMKFGRHRMAPVLSPKKSIEGAVGGVCGSVLVGCLYGAFLIAPKTEAPVYITVIVIAVMCVCGALLSMVGDLAASAIKRNHEIKDYGKLLPGHGGIMDRFDSVIFVAPIVYILSRFI
ncbi:MAG: phosphatidate cytidylyltransferase [Lachnospiraceae bacterium]|nr:phosphatidate cytidylyltransferase [Lachnospiraceae bacterium]